MALAALDTSTAINVTFANGQSYTVWDEDAGEHAGQGPVREVFSRDWLEGRAEWNILAKWSDRIGIAIAVLGGGSIVGGNPVYALPTAYPEFPAWIGKRIECTGVGLISASNSNTVIGAPQFARMRIIFGPPEYDPTSATLAGELELDFSQSAFALDQQKPSFQWASGGDISPSIAPSFRLTTILASLTLYNRGTLNQGLIANLCGSVNNATFQGYPVETVCFRGAKSRRTLTMQGQLNYSLTMLFEIMPGNGTPPGSPTWNTLFKPGTGWAAFTIKGSGSKLFPPANLSSLLV